MRIDQCTHSLFGASKVAADVMVQEYGRYFGMSTAAFRGGCLTGPQHSGAQLHGFLAYLVRCAVTGTPYTIFGYKGKQVRDNIHSRDLVSALWAFHRNPRPGAVYNIGGSRHSNCSVLEAIALIQEITGREIDYTLSDENRSGDHIWWISDVRRFQRRLPRLGVRVRPRGDARGDRRGRLRALRVEMSDGMLVSIVIPAHDEADCIEPTLRRLSAVLRDADIDHEIVVVDDHSSDGTADLVARIAQDMRRAAPGGEHRFGGFRHGGPRGPRPTSGATPWPSTWPTPPTRPRTW